MRAIPPAIICGLGLILTSVSSDAQVGAQQNTSAPAQQEAKPAQIDKPGLLILIRQTLTALDLSNKTGNYGILREISAPGFAAVNDSARLSRSFQSQRERNLDYSGVLAYEPQLTIGPETTKDGLLHFAGVFPSAVGQITFNMYFEAINGRWKLFGLAADVGPAGPVAPVPQPQGSPGPATAKQPPAAKKQ